MKIFRVALWGTLAGCLLGGCRSVTFPTTPLPVTRAVDGTLAPAPITFLADTSYRHVDDVMLRSTMAAQSGDRLLAWGRYPINRAGDSAENNGYKEMTIVEAQWLKLKQIALLPIIAPDQATLSRGESEGQALANESVEILLRLMRGSGAAIGTPGILVFLDVEGDRAPISDDFLMGWCKGISATNAAGVRFLPAVYTSAIGSASARRAVAHVHASCRIEGLWLARYLKTPARPTYCKRAAEAPGMNSPC
jgi:hypothetical protein